MAAIFQLVFSLAILSSNIGAVSVKTVYIAFPERKRDWTSGFHFCVGQGMHLVTPLSTGDYEAILRFMSTPLWNDEIGTGRGPEIWTGLHSPSGNRDNMFDSSCTPTGLLCNVTWLGAKEIDEKFKCFRMKTGDWEWQTEGCDKEFIVICEKSAGDCTFEDRIDTTTTTLPISPAVVDKDLTCEKTCLGYSNNQSQCWAYTFNVSTGYCSIYSTFSLDSFLSTTKHQEGENLRLKICHEFFVNETVVPRYGDRIKEPLSFCELRSTVSVAPIDNTTIMLDPQTTTTSSTPITSTWSRTGPKAWSFMTALESTTIPMDSKPVHWDARTTPTFPTTIVSNYGDSTDATFIATTHGKYNKKTSSKTESSTFDGTKIYSNSLKSTSILTSTSFPLASSLTSEYRSAQINMDMSGKPSSTTSAVPKEITPQDVLSGDIQTLAMNTKLAARDKCLCTCQTENLSLAEKRVFLESILNTLDVNVTSMSSTRRKYISAVDDRVSANSIGYLGGILLCIPFVAIVIVDLVTLKSHFNIMNYQ